MDEFATEFDCAFERFRDEYITLHDEGRRLQARALNQGTSKEDEIRRASIINRMADMREGKGDFYTYRYLARVGFLPNYAFPRRATSVYFTDNKESILRSPSIALREFAPLNTIYFRRQRYQVVRAQPRARGQAHHWSRLKVCACGNFFMDDQVAQASACPACGASLIAQHTHERVLELPDMVARGGGRISADEEERMRRGFRVEPYYQRASGAPQWTLLDAGGGELATVTYARRSPLLLVNHGPRATDETGFRYCEKCRAWLASADGEQKHLDPNDDSHCPAGAEDGDIQHEVLLFHQGHHDFLLLETAVPANTPKLSFGWSLLYAITNGFQVAFGADESEISGHVFEVPGKPEAVRLLLYEQDEGGAGLLHNLMAADSWQRVARRALEILHVNPDTGLETAGACERVCYDCLLSYYNQQQHEQLDRKVAVPFLQKLLTVTPFTAQQAAGGPTWDVVKSAAVGAEESVFPEMERRGFPPPVDHHCAVRDAEGVALAEADLLYPAKLVVWVHGSVHLRAHVAARDAEQKRKLKVLSYRVVEIWPERLAEGLRDLAERLGRPDLMHGA